MQSKLAALRRYKNISQREMGDLIGITVTSYSKKERGITQFTSSEMFIIADIFDLTIDKIFLPPDFIKHEVKAE